MKRQLKIILAFVILGLVAVFSVDFFIQETQSSGEDVSSSVEESQEISEEVSEKKVVEESQDDPDEIEVHTVAREKNQSYPGLDIYLDTYFDEFLTYSYFEPVTESDRINEAISSWLDAELESFTSEAKEFSDPKREGWTSHLYIEVFTNPINKEKEIYSLHFTESRTLAGSNSEEKFMGFTFNIGENRLYHFDELIQDPDSTFSDLVYDELMKNVEISQALDQELFAEAMTNLAELNYHIKDGELHLLFDSYQIASGNVGAIDLSLNNEELEPYLSDLGKSLVYYQGEEVDVAENSEAENSGNKSEEVAQASSQEESREEDSTEAIEPVEAPQAEREKVDGTEKYVALTFDDGPHPTNTPELLDILDSYGVSATFFVTGQNSEYYPNIVSDIAARGHEIGNHSYNHPDFTTLSQDEVQNELTRTDQLIVNATGTKPSVVRPPYGASNDQVQSIIANNGQKTILWSVDTRDWESKDPTAILNMVKENTFSGSIILMHDIHATTIDAVPAVIEYLQSQGYQFVTVSELP